MTDRTYQKEEYRFNEKDHLHEILIDGEWIAMTGISSVVKDMTNFGQAAYYGSRRALMELGYDPKDNPDFLDDFYHKMSLLGTKENTKTLLRKAYTAHATHAKARAEKGTSSHDVVDKYVKMCIKENKGKPMESEEPIVKKFLELTKSYAPYTFVASEKHGYNRELFIAGITDIIVESEKFGLGIWDLKDRPAIYGKDLVQCGGYTLLFPLDFTHVMGIPLEGKEIRVFNDIPQLQSAFTSQLNVYRFMNSVEK